MQKDMNPLVFAVGNSHIDPVWVWDWHEGMREVQATFRAASERLEREPDLLFTASSAFFYEWIERTDPKLFERIQRHVQAGRWLVVGGEWVEPDCNLPSGESVCRHLLYSQRYFSRAFGQQARIGYNVDSFGHAGSLPQLFARGGLSAYVMMRPQEHEKHIAADTFRWRGIDGTELITYRIPFGYETGFARGNTFESEAEREQVLDRGRALLARAQQDGSPRMLFFGVGDHGGGPTQAAIEAVRTLRTESGGRLDFGHPAQYLDAIGLDTAALPVVDGDLQRHAPGCYSVQADAKADNANAERALLVAEHLASLCQMITGRDLAAQPRLERAWKAVLFGQFHDSLGGTCSVPATEQVRTQVRASLAIADELVAEATQILATQADTWRPGSETAERHLSLNPFSAHYPVPMVVLNPLAWTVRAPVVFPHAAGAAYDEQGLPVPIQSVASREGTRYPTHTLTILDVPPLGHRVCWLLPPGDGEPGRQGPPARTTDGAATIRDNALDNGLVRVVVDTDQGRIASLDALGHLWLGNDGIRAVTIADPSDTWSHGVGRYDGEEETWALTGCTITERGPVRAAMRLAFSQRDSVMYQEVAVYSGLPYADLTIWVDWRERHRVLKLVVPTSQPASTCTAGLPYGASVRPTSGVEDVMQRWVDVASDRGGLAILSDSTYAFDCLPSSVRLTLLRSPRFADHGTDWQGEDALDHPVTDQGWHRFHLRLVPHAESWRDAGVMRLALEHGMPLPLSTETWHRGTWKANRPAMEVDPPQAVVTVVKRAEDGGGWILRLVETSGRPCQRVRLRLVALKRRWQGDLGAFEVKTLFVPDDTTRRIREVPITEAGEKP